MTILGVHWFANSDPRGAWILALLLALAYAIYSVRTTGLDPCTVYWAGVYGILFGLWGGYLLGFVYYGTEGRPGAWVRVWSGGQAQYGGLLAGMLAVAIYL